MIARLWRFIRGYAEVRCDGGLFGRFFDSAIKQGLGVFGVRMRGNTATFRVDLADYAALARIARKSQCRMRVTKKRGLYFAWRGLDNKAALISGLLVFCTVLYLLGGMVFVIEIGGESVIPKKTLIESLARNGLSVGMMQSAVDTDRVEHLVMLENERLAWIAVNLSFGVATVEVRDRLPEPPEDGPGARRIVASRDAQIKSISVTSGRALVAPGDVVSAGQPLAEAESNAEGSWTEGARAVVMAYTSYTEIFTVSKDHVFRARTGRVFEKRAIVTGEGELPISFGKNSFRYFDVVRYERPITLFSVELPVRLAVAEYHEVEQSARRINIYEARAVFEEYQRLYERGEMAGRQILNRVEEVSDTGAGYEFLVRYLCLENIGIPQQS
jgi:similar to stage IV sporulation protein